MQRVAQFDPEAMCFSCQRDEEGKVVQCMECGCRVCGVYYDSRWQDRPLLECSHCRAFRAHENCLRQASLRACLQCNHSLAESESTGKQAPPPPKGARKGRKATRSVKQENEDATPAIIPAAPEEERMTEVVGGRKSALIEAAQTTVEQLRHDTYLHTLFNSDPRMPFEILHFGGLEAVRKPVTTETEVASRQPAGTRQAQAPNSSADLRVVKGGVPATEEEVSGSNESALRFCHPTYGRPRVPLPQSNTVYKRSQVREILGPELVAILSKHRRFDWETAQRYAPKGRGKQRTATAKAKAELKDSNKEGKEEEDALLRAPSDEDETQYRTVDRRWRRGRMYLAGQAPKKERISKRPAKEDEESARLQEVPPPHVPAPAVVAAPSNEVTDSGQVKEEAAVGGEAAQFQQEKRRRGRTGAGTEVQLRGRKRPRVTEEEDMPLMRTGSVSSSPPSSSSDEDEHPPKLGFADSREQRIARNRERLRQLALLKKTSGE